MIMNYNKLSHVDKRYWNICYADNIECAICHDGLLFKFDLADIAHILNKYPTNFDHTVWYFNDTKDREIAELCAIDLTVTVNPQFMYQNFKEILT
jgi:hypothetical protein